MLYVFSFLLIFLLFFLGDIFSRLGDTFFRYHRSNESGDKND